MLHLKDVSPCRRYHGFIRLQLQPHGVSQGKTLLFSHPARLFINAQGLFQLFPINRYPLVFDKGQPVDLGQ